MTVHSQTWAEELSFSELVLPSGCLYDGVLYLHRVRRPGTAVPGTAVQYCVCDTAVARGAEWRGQAQGQAWRGPPQY